MEIFIPAYGTITSLELSQNFISHVFSKHGLPVSIVSDRGFLFVSSFWNRWTDREGKSDSRTVLLDLFYPVFHVSLLEPVKQSSIPNLNQLPPPPALVEEQEEWEVAQVLDSKLKGGKLWYPVEWKGFSEDPERTTWEPASSLTNSPDLFKDFHSLYPDKPGPNTSRV
ncbi:hypothetical protein O181_086129 [Austropuccinia psidii MF-1]|uniref:Chromo domain-containing protein n=1 Tax=Austropuccinia psidii MF-1 TaxID=1389203 RepID=A0A9Q3IN89_9BASI|nr:hypothetical protein [Austropuccinia psidii MF-1]